MGKTFMDKTFLEPTFMDKIWAFRPGRGSASCSASPRPSAMD